MKVINPLRCLHSVGIRVINRVTGLRIGDDAAYRAAAIDELGGSFFSHNVKLVDKEGLWGAIGKPGECQNGVF